MEEIPMGEEVLAGAFFLNGCPILVLFDSGASHNFMSSICAKEAKLSLVASRMSYMISTLGGQVDVDRLVHWALLDLAG
jgi:predicted aspartyl protease